MAGTERQTLTPEEIGALFGASRWSVQRQARAKGQFAGVPAIEVLPGRYVFSRVLVERRLAGERASS